MQCELISESIQGLTLAIFETEVYSTTLDIAYGNSEEQYQYEHMVANLPIPAMNSHIGSQYSPKSIHNFSSQC